ncbi:ABC transporter permease [Inconstantimicrobium mannanitabidum]|uniref:Uncharacterized protein n=1 Tax=Inconstantimicrobium mannanitabidum TaxID=1604901 RepID=A0ACB5RD29_9CLOT|nr:ABC transporter permease [Clostridium sp. TW13]GKX66707.1 hypothetical protein rsdtw13_19650 [Clostridium sp. TW13]
MFRLLMIAVKDIYRQAFKTIVFSVIIATCISALIIALSLNKSISDAIESNIINSITSRQVLVGANNTGDKSFEEYLKYLRSVKHVEDAYRYVNPIMAEVSQDSVLSKGSYVLSSGNEKYFPKVIDGNDIDKNEKNVAIIPQRLYIQNTNGKLNEVVEGKSFIGKNINLAYKNEGKATRYTYRCRVVGTYKNELSENSNKIYIPLNDMYGICNDSGQYESRSNFLFTVIVDKKDYVNDVIKELSSKNNFKAELSKPKEGSEVGSYKVVSKVSGYMVSSIFIFLLIMLYICVTNIAINSKQNLCIYKALGYNNRHIFKIVFLEAVIISIIGYIEAILISILANSFLINPVINSRATIQLSVSISIISVIMPLAILIPIDFIVSLFAYVKFKNIYPAILMRED